MTYTDHQPVPGGPAWQDDPQGWQGFWGPPAGADDVDRTQPGSTGGSGGVGGGQDRRGGAGARRRFGALALGAALVAGAGAGAVTAALVGRSSTPAAQVTTTAATFSGSGMSTQAVIAKVEPALVDIHTTGTSSSASSAFGNGSNPFGGSTTTTEAAGTGMIIRSDGLVLTNAHVLEGATAITVTLDGSTATHTATLVGEDAAKDIALIQVQGVSGLPTVSLGDSSSVASGDQVVAIGNALDLQNGGFTASSGIISGLDRSIQTDNGESLSGLIQTSAAISSGDSGGALVDASGQVIGMNTASAASTSTNTASDIGFAIPSNQITALIATLEKGSVGQTTVGSSDSAGSSTDQSTGTGSTGTYGTYGGYGSSGGYGTYSSGGGYGGFGGYGSSGLG